MQIEINLCRFYALSDERRLFQGFNDIAAITELRGVGRNLLVDIDLRRLSKDDLLDMIALLQRYGIPLAPLGVLAAKKRFSWLNDPTAYFYGNMFKSSISAG
ncbi:hypothetical protein PQR25_30470 [Paraburkholderia nemoris]|uniref:hypothetical protein n=1 Tax=Paraburkholderia nemoris TaxID=2793076 RepID=UPI0038B9F253